MKPWEYGRLHVSENGKYLKTGDRPFFWLGDTAWWIFSQLHEEEARIYLKNRKEKGFNVIQATLIHDWPQVNADGACALTDDDFAKPDIDGGYWDRIYRIVDMAEELGLYMALLPTWGNNVGQGYLNEKNVDPYLDFLLERFGNRPNVIWIVGGDVKGDAAFAMFNRIGTKLKKAGTGQLIGFHPFGRTSSSLWFQQEDWLDFNMFQSGHRRYDQVTMTAWDDNQDASYVFGEDNYRYVRHDLALTPVKPTLDGEPSYEQILQGLHDEKQPYWQSWDVRRYAYWSCFAGACGHTYGDNSIIQFYDEVKAGKYGARRHWKTEMHNIGASCMTHLKKLMESVDFANGSAADDLVVSGQGERYDHIGVFAGKDYLLAYDYSGKPFTLDLSGYQTSLECHWLDPITGIRSYAGSCDNGISVSFTPPQRLEGHNDWVLVLEREQ